jgi:tRNA pseudouridine38-40 synthase
MERYQIIIAYDGTDFHGSQYQPDVRTIQREIETALHRLEWTGKSVIFSSRTDTGVHAAGQVAAFDMDWNHSPDDLRNALNALLPNDVAIKKLIQCSRDFQPRFHAVSRKYRYRIYCQPIRDPIKERFAWRVWPRPDFEIMKITSNFMLGVHDFSSFGNPTSTDGTTIRKVNSVQWRTDEDDITFEIVANAFLYHMVRRLIFVFIQIGQKNMEVGEFYDFINNPQPNPIQGLAPSQGLHLIEINYPVD